MRRRLVRNGLLLAGTQSVLRLFSLAFQAYLTRLAGAQAMGLFALAQSVNLLAATFASSGLSLAVTRLCAENPKQQGKIVQKAMLLALLLGLSAAFFLFAFAPWICKNWIGEAQAQGSLRLFALALPVMAAGSCLQGGFLAQRKVGQSVLTQFLDALTSVAVTVAMLYVGPKTQQFACLSLTAGAVGGEIACTVSALLLWRRGRKTAQAADLPKGSGRVFARILSISAPVAAGAYVRAALRTAENLMIPAGLAAYGMTHDAALGIYGVFKAMAMPAVMFPSGIVTAFAVLLVPEIAQRQKAQNLPFARIFNLTAFYACLCGGMIWLHADLLAAMLGGGADLAQMLAQLAFLCPIWYLDCVTDSAVNALDGQKQALKYNLAESVLRLALMRILIAKWGMTGYILTILLCSGGNLFCSMRCLGRLSGQSGVYRFLPVWGSLGVMCVLFGRALAMVMGVDAHLGMIAALIPAGFVLHRLVRGGAILVASRSISG